MIDRKFNMLTVVGVHTKRSTSGHKMWVCLCECGKLRNLIKSRLTSGKAKSCGCTKRRPAINEHIVNNTIVDKTTGCHEWIGYRNADGYGRISFRNKDFTIHRLVWELYNGKTDNHVLHKCDNPCCCNLDHLFIGTNMDNIKDCVSKGRNTKGSTHGMSRLNTNKVIEIKKLISTGAKHKQIADKFDISRQCVTAINTGRTWKEVK